MFPDRSHTARDGESAVVRSHALGRVVAPAGRAVAPAGRAGREGVVQLAVYAAARRQTTSSGERCEDVVRGVLVHCNGC